MSTVSYTPSAAAAPPSDPAEQRREELCLQLAENLHDMGAVDFTREITVGGKQYLIQIKRK